ncbi:hypothetical protein QTP88_018025 [Uroleucon formosanum]
MDLSQPHCREFTVKSQYTNKRNIAFRDNRRSVHTFGTRVPALSQLFFVTISSKDFIIIKTADCANHLKAAEYLAKTNLSFHTFPSHCDCPIQAVIRHLHHSIHVDDIVTALTELGFSVLSTGQGKLFDALPKDLTVSALPDLAIFLPGANCKISAHS